MLPFAFSIFAGAFLLFAVQPLWFSLAATASILLLATTNKLGQDLAIVPFLWVLPLSLYLLSFILCFDHPRWYSRSMFSALFVLGAFVDAYLLFAGHNAPLLQQVIGYSSSGNQIPPNHTLRRTHASPCPKIVLR